MRKNLEKRALTTIAEKTAGQKEDSLEPPTGTQQGNPRRKATKERGKKVKVTIKQTGNGKIGPSLET